jgi:hypothetical protein
LQLVFQQPAISGGLTLVILYALLCHRDAVAAAPVVAAP